MADEIGMDKEVISVKFGYNISNVGEMIANDAINIALWSEYFLISFSSYLFTSILN